MYQLTLQDSRVFRRKSPQILKYLQTSCPHDICETVDNSIKLCKRCLRSWYLHEPQPPSGNPALIRFIKPCEHIHVKTLPGTTTQNQCLECDQVFEKSEIAKMWKNVRHGVTNITKQIVGHEQQIENKISTGKPLVFIWDPDKYGEKLWNVEYK